MGPAPSVDACTQAIARIGGRQREPDARGELNRAEPEIYTETRV
jgi:hypothetical protein